VHGIRVLRFTNEQVLNHIDGVLNDILNAVNS
jgi:very-short-patch-repair endonuclease